MLATCQRKTKGEVMKLDTAPDGSITITPEGDDQLIDVLETAGTMDLSA